MEQFYDGSRLLALIVRADYEPGQTAFLTPDDAGQQVGFVAHGAGHEIARHCHADSPGGLEAVLVRRGRVEVGLYGADRREMAVRILGAGDLLVVMGVGHRFRMLEDTVLLEIKQGTRTGSRKELF